MGWREVFILVRCPCFRACKSGMYILGVGKGVLFREVSSEGVLTEEFHCSVYMWLSVLFF